MTIIAVKNSSTSSLLDVWQAHIQQQQADKAKAAGAGAAGAGSAGQKTATTSDKTTANTADGNKTATPSTTAATPDANNNGTSSRKIDADMVKSVREASDAAKALGGAAGGGGADAASSAGGSGPQANGIVEQTIQKLKDMLAKVMAQLEAVRNNDSIPPEEKMAEVQTLSAQAMTIRAQIQTLMDPTKTTGTRVNTTA
ncbi:hypothetical protein PPN31114_01778 [Pandoraea pneumonica]|jgi:hypothetical protein|uniref:Uncharacterized protein n=1 Tax=Pandoraea pneumonica TaxID=2508299 RepID=A0A5E4TZN3_9BURK|nr:FlxA-like family protein [Pandoraea pneumonica]VVD93307.1 hypothetical protein PPN31114_01778 [Pandoraea pneumonica]